MNIRLRNRKGEGLSSQSIAIIVGIILMTLGATYGGLQLVKSRKTKVDSDFRMISSDVLTAISEVGLFDSISEDDDFDSLSEKYTSYLRTLNRDYLHTQICFEEVKELSEISALSQAEREEVERKTCVITPNGFYGRTTTKDPWDTPYRFAYVESDTVGRTFVLFSAGGNGIFDTPIVNSLDGEKLNKYDDIVCVVKIKDTSNDKEITFDKFL